MSLDFATITLGANWQQRKTNTGFADTVQGPDGLSYNVSYTVGASAANSIYVAQGTLAASASATVDLFSFTDQLGQAVSMVRVYAMIVNSTNSSLKVEPGATNPLVWFFGGTTPSITVPSGGSMAFGQPAATTVSATARNIKLTNTGAVSLTYDIAIIGGP